MSEMPQNGGDGGKISPLTDDARTPHCTHVRIISPQSMTTQPPVRLSNSNHPITQMRRFGGGRIYGIVRRNYRLRRLSVGALHIDGSGVAASAIIKYGPLVYYAG